VSTRKHGKHLRIILQAVETRYVGPTNHRGARIIVRCEHKSRTYPWDHALGIQENHRAAAEAFLVYMDWLNLKGWWAQGATRTGYAFVFCAD
jgi:hypothetical protein